MLAVLHCHLDGLLGQAIDSLCHVGLILPRSVLLVAWTGFPDAVSVQTKTLRYNKVSWVTVERLEQHWVKATADARIIDPPGVRDQTM